MHTYIHTWTDLGAGEHLISSISTERKSQTVSSYNKLWTPNRLIKVKRVPKLSGVNSDYKNQTNYAYLETFMHKITTLKEPENNMRNICGVKLIYHCKRGKNNDQT